MAMHIREQDEYDRTPDPDDMTFTEAQIAERMSTFASEINTINNVATAMTRDMLARFGFAARDESIIVSILVVDPEETINWIDQPSEHIDLRRIADHVHGNARVTASTSGSNSLYITPIGGSIADGYVCIAGMDNA